MQFLKTPRARSLVLFAVVFGLAGCGLPRSGPNKREIYAGSVQRQGDAFVVPVNEAVTRATAVVPALGFSQAFVGAGVVGSDTIRAGDKLGLRIWENVDNGLLASNGLKSTQLSEVQVDGNGFIFVPYAGRMKAEGNSPDALRRIITNKLADQTPDPQVEVIRLAGDGSAVTVIGSLAGQGVYPIERPTRTLSAMIAKAGGVSIPAEVALVSVTRGGRTGKVWLKDLYSNPKLDIALRPGDTILVEEDSRAFTAMGATGQQSRVQFQTQTLSALEAIAQVGGLQTNLADPTGVFVLRNESEDIARAVLGRNDISGDQRMVYVLNLTEPNGMFDARDFVIRDGDTVYVTEAPFVQWQKTLGALTGAVNSGTALKNAGN